MGVHGIGLRHPVSGVEWGGKETGAVAAIPLPAPVALARLSDTMTPPGLRQLLWEPKWDGYRAIVSGGRLWSRSGTNLTPLFRTLRRS